MSVVVPAYNAERFVGRTVESALGQTHQALEILVVDDGSTDDTAAIVTSLARGDRRVKLIKQENSGPEVARNRGILEAQGDLIATLDADDLWHPTKIERQVESFGGSSDLLGVVYTKYCTIDEDDRVIPQKRRMSSQWTSTPEGQVLAALVWRNFLGNGSTPLIRRGCFGRVGLYDPSYRERGAPGVADFDFYLRLAEAFEFRVVPEILVGYRQLPDSLSADLAALRRGHRLVVLEAFRRTPGLPRALKRWSLANLTAWAAWRQYARGKRAIAAAWGLRAAILDPMLLLSPEWRWVGRHLLSVRDRAGSQGAAPSDRFPAGTGLAVADGHGETSTRGRYERALERRHNRLVEVSQRLSHQRLPA